MKTQEVAIIKTKLGNYRHYKELAEQADAEASDINLKIRMLGYPGSPSLGGVRSQNPKSIASKLNKLISDRDDALTLAKEYRRFNAKLKGFIESAFEGETQVVAYKHFILGKPYPELAEEFFQEPSALRQKVDRSLIKADTSIAREWGLL